jgi:hypothetical protein
MLVEGRAGAGRAITWPPAVVSPAPRDAWRVLAETDPTGLVTQTPEWIDVLCRAGYEDASRLYRTRDGRHMLLPLVRRRGNLPRSVAPLASLPAAWGMGGLLAETPLTADDVTLVVSDLSRLGAVHVHVRPNPLHAEQWAQASLDTTAFAVPRRAHVLDLAGGPDVVWNERFASSARRAVRKAEANGVEARRGGLELLSDFRGLFELSVRRWAEMQHEPLQLAKLRAFRRDPPAKFLHVAEAMPHRLRVWIAYHDGAPVAGLIVLLGSNASYTRGAMDKDRAGSLRANELLHWSAIREACAAGCRHYHLGETGASEALARFKEKLGAVPTDYAEYHLERLPVVRSQEAARNVVKHTVGFRDV